jgi:hypothetical protein
VFDDSGTVPSCADSGAKGLDEDQLRVEIKQRGLKATMVRTLTAQEIEAE